MTEIQNKWEKLVPCKSVKYLGFFIDCFLNWITHLTSLSKKLSRAAEMLSKIRHYVDWSGILYAWYTLEFSHLLCLIKVKKYDHFVDHFFLGQFFLGHSFRLPFQGCQFLISLRADWRIIWKNHLTTFRRTQNMDFTLGTNVGKISPRSPTVWLILDKIDTRFFL